MLLKLTNSHKNFVIDDEDYELIIKHNNSPSFRLNTTGSVVVWSKIFATWIPVSRIILKLNLNYSLPYSDHIDCDKLNNKRSNLRVATPSQNNCNSIKRRNKTNVSSKFKGVYLFHNGKWKAQASLNGKMYHLGYFSDEVEAALAYDDFALLNYGNFARINCCIYGY